MKCELVITIAHCSIELLTLKSATQRCMLVAMQIGTKDKPLMLRF